MSNISKNNLNNKSYTIPDNLDDSVAIENFISKHEGKKVVVVQGLGFVGAVMALVCANAFTEDYAVIGVDLPNENSYWKIRSINEGSFPLVAEDPNIADLFERSKCKENFFATFDPSAYQHADIIIVDINLDVEKSTDENDELSDFSVDLSNFEAAIRSIASKCREDVLVLVETTVPPGTCEKIVQPIIEEEFMKRGFTHSKYKLGHSYERVMPGPNYVSSIRNFPRVYAGINDVSANAVEYFLNTIIDTANCELTRLSHTNATEIAKVLENSYRAANIAFLVEWSRFAEEAGVDLYSIVNAIRVRPTHSNLMYPGVGVGGYCLTKDPLLASWARKSFFGSQSDLEMSVNGVAVNDQMPKYAFQFLQRRTDDLNSKQISLLGVSYRGDVGDTRFTPVEKLVALLTAVGAEVILHDPYISFWEECEREVTSDLHSVLSVNPDIVVISAGHSIYKQQQTIESLMQIQPALIYDTIGLLTDKQIELLGTKHSISVLGRGDL